MTITTTRRHRVYRARRLPSGHLKLSRIVLPPGTYGAERVPSPYGGSMCVDPYWIVLRGRMIGMSERGWIRFTGAGGSVTITEDAMSEDWEHAAGEIAAENDPSGNSPVKRLPQVETQATIGAWAKETFPGGDDLSPRHVVRLFEEVVELCNAAGARVIDLQDAFNRVNFGSTPESPEKVARELADCAIVLDVLAHRRGIDLRDEVDEKMRINRARTWKCNGDGTGYHVKQESN